MKGFDWLVTARVCVFFLRCVGLWPEETKSYRSLNVYNCYAIISVTFFTFINVALQIIYIYFALSDMEVLFTIISILPSEIAGVVKAYRMVFFQKTLWEFIAELNSDVFQPKNLEQIDLVKINLQQWKRIFTAAWITAGSTATFFVLTVLLDKSGEKKLIFFAWFPFDYENFYRPTLLYQAISLIFIVMTNTNLGLFLAALNMYAGCQFDLLCDNLRTLKHNEEHKLLDCIKHHKIIMKFTNRSNSFWSIVVAFQFFASAIILGISLYKLTVITPMSPEYFRTLFFESTMLVDIFFFCWFGNEIQLKSGDIVYAAFESDWTTWSIQSKKKLLFFMMNVSQPVKVSAYNLFYLTLETFVGILRSAWSFFTLVNQVTA